MTRYLLETVVFACGAITMILELVGSRILAPYLGTSVVVWTGLIGIVLGSLSIGYWQGGKIADKSPNYKSLSAIIFAAALSIAWIGAVQSLILNFFQTHIPNMYANITLSAAVLFGPAGVFLGMITPYAVRMKLNDINRSGTTVGHIYALSTIGSIAGTFLAGFILLSYFGCIHILIFLSVLLVILSIIVFRQHFQILRFSVLILLVLGIIAVYSYDRYSEKSGNIDVNTPYNRIWIWQGRDAKSHRSIRFMSTGPGFFQSAMYTDQPEELYLYYTRFFRLAGHFHPEISHALMIGGGAYSFPKYFLRNYPDARMDVVEIDSRYTELAMKYFSFSPNDKIRIFHEDGRMFIRRTRNTYDLIISDAYHSSYSVPFHLTTLQTMQRIHALLNHKGVFLTNLISAIDGDKGQFFRAEYATLKAVFRQVYVFPVNFPKDSSAVQNIVIVAIKSDELPNFTSRNPEWAAHLKHLRKEPIECDLPVLTDNFAPVDRYIMPIFK